MNEGKRNRIYFQVYRHLNVVWLHVDLGLLSLGAVGHVRLGGWVVDGRVGGGGGGGFSCSRVGFGGGGGWHGSVAAAEQCRDAVGALGAVVGDVATDHPHYKAAVTAREATDETVG